ncbi:MAG: endonuclease/exonuclease/phosphatase family protein [Kiloniellales bacterium]|nr:endonuclease/exonuclease/phosphatase family protein [Kiloniellales bacterium]
MENRDAGPGQATPLEARIEVLRPQLRRLEADVLCLQEVNAEPSIKGGPRVPHALDRLLEGTPYEGFRRFAGGGAGDPHFLADVHNLVILSRFPMIAARSLRHVLVEPPRYRPAMARPAAEAEEAVAWDRPILAVEIDLPDAGRLHVINLHLRAPLAAAVAGQKESAFVWRSTAGWAEGFFLAAVKRAGQALEARLLVDEIFDRDAEARIVVLGDFNAEEWEVPVRTLCAEVEDTGKGRLAGRALVPLERSLPETRRFSLVHHGRRVMLDHILASRALLAGYRGIELHNETVGDELIGYALVDQATVSYHAPLVAEFALSSS